MHRSIIGSLAVATACLVAEAHEDHGTPPKYDVAKQFAPSPVPDRLVLTWSDDPATTIDVTYRTDTSVDHTVCEWIKAADVLGDHQQGDVAEAATLEGTHEDFTSDLGTARVHSIELRDLEPQTKYAYRVGDGVNWSPWQHFTTAVDGPAPFEFVYFGDAQNSVRALWSRVRREAHNEAPRAAFALHAGDLINRAEVDYEWGEWHEAGGWLNGTIPTVATPGNHEYTRRLLLPAVSGHWRPTFSFPLNGPKGLEETCYWFDFQGTRIIAMDSNKMQKEQAEWLDRTLSALPPTKWTILTFHHPIFSAAKNRDNATLRGLWKPIIDKHGVDLVLTGHDHAYSRSGLGGPADAGQGGAAENVGTGARALSGSTVYVVSVSGPKMYDLNESWDVMRNASGVQLYQAIAVDADAIRYQAFTASGELYDAFTLEKDADGKATLTEQTPSTAEIRR